MSSSSDVEKKITLKSSDGEIFEVEEWVVMEWLTVKHMMEVNGADTVISLPNVTSTILSKVIEYSKKHGGARQEKKDDKSYDEELKNWDLDFVKLDDDTTIDLFLAANYLKIKSLIDLTYPIVAENIIERWHLRKRALDWLVFIVTGIFIVLEIMAYIVRHGQWTRDWRETAKIWLIVCGLCTYLGMFITRMVWVIHLISDLY